MLRSCETRYSRGSDPIVGLRECQIDYYADIYQRLPAASRRSLHFQGFLRIALRLNEEELFTILARAHGAGREVSYA